MDIDQKKWLNEDFWVTEFNWLEDVRKDFEIQDQIWVHDCTMREAEQQIGIVFKPDEKLAIAKQLDKLGVNSYEIFPVISQDDADVVKEILKLGLKPQMRCLCRWLQKDIDVALETGTKAVLVENTANPWNNKVAYGVSEDDIVKRFVEAVRYAKDNGMHVTCMPWDTYRAPLDFLEKLYKAIVYEGGADRMVVVDSSGVGLPQTTTWLLKKVRSWIPGIPVEFHCHNETGLAGAAMLSALIGGANGVHTVLNGYGTRAGNAATEEVVFNAKVLLGMDTTVDLKQLYPSCRLVQDLSKIPVPPTKPIIGDNLYTYCTGLSIDLWKKASAAGRPHAFVPFHPHIVGYPGYGIALGKPAGKFAVKMKLEQMGIEVNPDSLGQLTIDIKNEATLRKASLTDDVIKMLAIPYMVEKQKD